MSQDLIRLDPEMISTDWQLLRKVRPNDQEYQEMLQSIRDEGVKVPIVVRKIPVDGGEIFSLVDGGNRLHISKALKLPNIPCFVEEDCNDIRALSLQASLNIQRIETKKGELARQINRISNMDDSLSQVQIAKLFGKSIGWVRQILSINDLPDYVITLLDEGKITTQNAILLTKAPEVDLGKLIDDAQVLTKDAFEVLVNECVRQRRTHSGKQVSDDWVPTPERRKVAELLAKVQRKKVTAKEVEHINAIESQLESFFEGILYALSMDELTVESRRVERTAQLEAQQEREILRQLERKAEETAELQKRLEKFTKENT